MNLIFKDFNSMRRFFLYIILFILQINTSYAEEGNRIAYSKRYGIEVFTSGKDKKWCDSIIHLKVLVKDELFLKNPDFKYIFSKIGKKVISERECPVAEIAGIKAYDLKKDKVYDFVAVKNDGWEPHEVKEENNNKVDLSEDFYDGESFIVSGWQPPKEGSDVIVTSGNVYEHEIKTKNNKCAIRYTLPKATSKTKDWYMTVSGNDCDNYYLHGKAKIRIYNSKGRLVSRGAGNFSKGYFTDDKIFDAKFMERYAYGIDNQRLSYLIDSDAINRIHFVSYLRSEYRKKYDKFTKWHGCDPFIVSAVTDNYAIFLNDTEINDNVIDAAKDYAVAYCPDASVMKVYGVKKPSEIYGVDIPLELDDNSWKEDPDFYFGVTLNRNPITGAWVYDESKVKNRVRYSEIIKQADKIASNDNLSMEYYGLLKSKFSDKLAYMFEADKLDDLNAFVLASMLNGNDSAYVNVMLNVASSDGITSKSFFPIPMVSKCKVKSMCEQGWYLAGGYIKALPDDEKDAHGFSKFDFVASFIPDKVHKCQNSFCSEARNVLTLVQRRHRKLDFIPTRN